MKRTLAVVALLIAMFSAACGSDDNPAVDTGAANEDTEQTTGESGESTEDFNDADVEFAQNMIVHHQQAIEMSDMVIANGSSADVKALAEGIKEKQAPEIETLRGFLEEWGEKEVAPGEMEDMPGMDMGGGEMMSEEEMADLEGAEGAEADRMFLEMMIEHHTSAIEMAQTEVEDGENADAKELAEKVIEDQKAEIAEMEKLLEELA